MARSYINKPTLNIDFIKPSAHEFIPVCKATEGGRNFEEETISMAIGGGGHVVATYEDCFIQTREQHEYATWLSSYLTGSFRFINVPLKTDWMGPFPILDRWPVPIVSGITHSDGSTFSDGSGYSQATVFGVTTASATVGAGILSMRVYDAARDLRWSDWFSINHATKGWRAYSYWSVISKSAEGTETVSGASRTYRDYQLAITPELREAVAAGTRVEFARPMFVAKLESGTAIRMRTSGFWVARPTLQFSEAY
ncbi:MAG TPA: hypothetical protein VK181_10540 [Rhizobium sp.]|nr:hypothetical protein [Rhizobium sp.]